MAQPTNTTPKPIMNNAARIKTNRKNNPKPLTFRGEADLSTPPAPVS
jgi:hypothetical protein